MSKRAILYARTSGDDGKNATSSIEGQLDLCREYANGQGWQVVKELSEDERGVSGARFDAPALNNALERAQAGEFDVLVIRDMDRFARKLAKQLVIEEQFKRAGVDVVYVLEEYADSPEGRLNKHIRATIAEYEREKVKQRTVGGRRRSVKAGNVILGGAGAPYGYRKVEKDGRISLEIVEDEAAIIRMIFNWYTLEKLSMQKITMRLTGMGVPTPGDKKEGKVKAKKRGKGEWSVSSIGHILAREAYAGTWYFGRRNTKARINNPKEHHIAVTVPAIIDRETWQLAKTLRNKNRDMASRNTQREYLLRRLLTCGHCGAAVSCQARRSHSGQMLQYYRCHAATNVIHYAHKCNMRHFRADYADVIVWDWVESIFSDPGAIRKNAELYRQQQAAVKKPVQDQLTVTDQLLKQSKKELEHALRLYLEKGDILRDMLLSEKERLEARIKALEAERNKLIRELEADTLTDEQIDALEAFAARVREGLEEAAEDFTTRRQLIESLGLRGKLLEIDGVQVVKVECHFNQSATLIVSQTSYDMGHKPLTLSAILPLYPCNGNTEKQEPASAIHD